jgi:signal recognition particle subunit SRP54
MSSRILGMGDMLTLIEKAQSQYDEEQSTKLAEKMMENRFDYSDFIEQLDQVQSMGPMDQLMKMIPGMSDIPGAANVKIDEKEIARKKAIVLSMTRAERQLEAELSPARRRRIAAGSGNSFIEVNKFIKQFNQSKDMMQGVMSGDMSQMMSGMMKQQGGGPNGKRPQMPAAMPDMSQLGDLSALMGGGAGGDIADMSQMFGGGLKGKATGFAVKQAMKRAQKKMKKGKKK